MRYMEFLRHDTIIMGNLGTFEVTRCAWRDWKLRYADFCRANRLKTRT